MAERVPVILVPTIGGAALTDGRRQLWPLRGLSWLFHIDRFATGRLRVERFEPGCGAFLFEGVWQPVIHALEERLGYQQGRDLFPFAYDFRAGVEDCAAALKEAARVWASHTGLGQRFVVVAHGHGALVARWWVDRLGGHEAVSHLFLVGSMDRGVPMALMSMLGSGFPSIVGRRPWALRLLALALSGPLGRLVRRLESPYCCLPLEPVVDSEEGEVETEDLPIFDEEDRVRLEKGRRVMSGLIEPPTVPTTYVYGKGHRTATGFFLKRGAKPSRARINWGAGDGLVLMRSARPADLRAGVSVHHVTGNHVQALQHPETFKRLATVLKGPANQGVQGLIRAWRRALMADPALVAASEQELPLILPVPGTDATLSPLKQELSALRKGGTLLLLGEQLEQSVPSIYGWLAFAPPAETGTLLPLRLNLQDLDPNAEPEEALLDLGRRRVQRRTDLPLGDGTLEEVLVSGRLLLLVGGLDYGLKVWGREGLQARLMGWRQRWRLARWVLIDPSRACWDLKIGARVLAGLDGGQRIHVGLTARAAGDLFTLSVDVSDRPGLGAQREGAAYSVELPTALRIDRQTGRLLDPSGLLTLSAPGFLPSHQERKVELSTDQPRQAVTFSMRRSDPSAAEFEIRLSLRGTPILHRTENLPYLASGGLLNPLWRAEILGVLREVVTRHEQLDELSRVSGALPSTAEGEVDERLAADLDRLMAPLPSRDGVVLLLTWLSGARHLARDHRDGWVLDQAINGLRPLLPPGRSVPFDGWESTFGGEDWVPLTFLTHGLAFSAAVARVEVPILREGVERGRAGGTGWLVAPDLLLTCLHVVEARGHSGAAPELPTVVAQAAASRVWFGHDGETQPGEPAAVRALVAWDRDRDFALLRLDAARATPIPPWAPWPIQIVRGATVRLNIVQHPRGQHKRVALRDNLAHSATERELRYPTDTDHGSSGAPVFNDDWQVVAMHRASREMEGGGFNVGVQVAAIGRCLQGAYPGLWKEIEASVFQPETN